MQLQLSFTFQEYNLDRLFYVSLATNVNRYCWQNSKFRREKWYKFFQQFFSVDYLFCVSYVFFVDFMIIALFATLATNS